MWDSRLSSMNKEGLPMNREAYRMIENHMLSCMDSRDYAHGAEHVRRVLYIALDIAAHEENVDSDVLVCACLLHDIGRSAQAADPTVCHAAAGAEMARGYLLENGFSTEFADRVAACIRAHRFRKDVPCDTIEAKILFDADKLDVVGAIGIARTLYYGAQFAEPLSSRSESGEILDGREKTGEHSFLHEYNFKLRKVYDGFHTARAAQIAASRRQIAEDFYSAILTESRDAEKHGKSHLDNLLNP